MVAPPIAGICPLGALRPWISRCRARSFARDAYHPYSRALVAAVPIPDPSQRRERKPLDGDMPSPIAPPATTPGLTPA